MSTQLKFRRGNTATATAFVGAEAEIFVNTDTNRVAIHDAVTPGGHVLASNTDLNSVNSLAQDAYNKANTGGALSGNVTISGTLTVNESITVNKDLSVTGNLFVTGNTTSVSANNLIVNDPMLILANGNLSDIVDIGFVAHYDPEISPGQQRHTGFFRHAETNEYYAFYNYDKHLEAGNNTIIIEDPSFLKSNINADIFKGNVMASFIIDDGVNLRDVQNTQNTNITAVNNFAAAGYTHANNAYNYSNTQVSIIAGINATQNTRLNSIETVNASQNTSITVIQGVDNTQNAQISIIQGVDNTQNTNITNVNNFAAAAYAHANNAFNSGNTFASIEAGIDATQNTRIQSLETVNQNQNTSITAVNNFAQGAYNTANGANGLAAGAFAASNTKVTSVSGTSGRVTSSGGTTPTIDLAASGVTASTYGSAAALQIPGFTVDTYGRITQANSTGITVASSVNAGTGITVNQTTGAVTVTNAGVTSAVAGTGISVSGATGAVTITNSGVTSITASTGISVNAGTGGVTITNTGVTSAVAGTGVSVSAGTGAVTFSIGQAVATGSSVQFGSFGVGTAASGTTGEIRATNNITAFYSDKRLKDIKGTIPDALAKLLTLSGVVYTQNKKAEEFGYNNYEQQVGVIAQDVQAVLPEVVKPAPFDIDENNQSKSGENYLTVQYEKLVPLLIEAIKEQQKQIEEIKNRLN